jgi:DNA-binding protein HU-beta
VNKSRLVREVSRRTGADPAQVASILDALLDAIRDTVAKGERIALSGFGAFERIRRNPRTGRNPHTGEAVKIPARNVPTFRPGTKFRESVAAPRRKKTTSRSSRT